MRETKGPQDFVSIADREVESLIRTRLAEAALILARLIGLPLLAPNDDDQ
jgi:hypothetical protein